MTRIFVVVPTTGAALSLVSLAPRPGLPLPTAFKAGDYRPLPFSADYARLAGPAGPIAKALGAAVPPHELKLSGSFDGGRSWEAPVALAHLLVAKGGAVVADPAAADRIVWATGAVDMDLNLAAGDYALAQKLSLSAPLFARAGEVPVVAVLPPGEGGTEAQRLLEGGGSRVQAIRAASIVEAAEAIMREAVGGAPRKSARRLAAAVGALAICAAAGLAALAVGAPDGGTITSNGGETQRAREAASLPPPPDPAQTKLRPSASETLAPPPPPVELFLVRAREGANCRRALFDASARRFEAVPSTPARAQNEAAFEPSTSASLCGVALGAADGLGSVDIRAEPADAFLPEAHTDGRRLFFLRSGAATNVVYRAHVSVGDAASPVVVRHKIVNARPDNKGNGSTP